MYIIYTMNYYTEARKIFYNLAINSGADFSPADGKKVRQALSIYCYRQKATKRFRAELKNKIYTIWRKF